MQALLTTLYSVPQLPALTPTQAFSCCVRSMPHPCQISIADWRFVGGSQSSSALPHPIHGIEGHLVLNHRPLGAAVPPRTPKKQGVGSHQCDTHSSSHEAHHLAVATIPLRRQQRGHPSLEGSRLLASQPIHRIDQGSERLPPLVARLGVLVPLELGRLLEHLRRGACRVGLGIRVCDTDVQDAGLGSLPESMYRHIATCLIASHVALFCGPIGPRSASRLWVLPVIHCILAPPQRPYLQRFLVRKRRGRGSRTMRPAHLICP